MVDAMQPILCAARVQALIPAPSCTGKTRARWVAWFCCVPREHRNPFDTVVPFFRINLITEPQRQGQL